MKRRRHSEARYAELKAEARQRYAAGESHRKIAEACEVAPGTVLIWCRGLERATADDSILSPREAARLTGIPKDAIARVIDTGELAARFGERPLTGGRTGPRSGWLIRREDLDRYVASLEPCRYPGCEKLGHTADGCCGREHAMSVTVRSFDPVERRNWLLAHYASPASENHLRAMRERAVRSWQSGTGLADGAIQYAGGLARQRWKGRWGGRAYGHLGGRPKVAASDEQVAEVRRLAAIGWGRPAIASHLELSEWLVRKILDS